MKAETSDHTRNGPPPMKPTVTYLQFNFDNIANMCGVCPYVADPQYTELDAYYMAFYFDWPTYSKSDDEFAQIAAEYLYREFNYIDRDNFLRIAYNLEFTSGDDVNVIHAILDPRKSVQPIKPGKLLSKIFGDAMPDKEKHISNIVEKWKLFKDAEKAITGAEYGIAKTAWEISDIYMTPCSEMPGQAHFGASYKSINVSCMRHQIDYYSNSGNHHPTEAYGSGDFHLAYVKDAQGRIGARVLLSAKAKKAAPIYAASLSWANVLADRVKADRGFHPNDVSSDMAGHKLLRIEGRYDTVVCPYIDANGVYDNGDYLILDGSENNGDYTTGVVQFQDAGEYCDCCEDYCDSSNWISHRDESVCDYCLRSNYTRSAYSDDYFPDDEIVEVRINAYRVQSWSQDEASNDAIYSEYHDEYLHPDFAITTESGNTFRPDDEGEQFVYIPNIGYYDMDECEQFYGIWYLADSDELQEAKDDALMQSVIGGIIAVIKWLANEPPLPLNGIAMPDAIPVTPELHHVYGDITWQPDNCKLGDWNVKSPELQSYLSQLHEVA